MDGRMGFKLGVGMGRGFYAIAELTSPLVFFYNLPPPSFYVHNALVLYNQYFGRIRSAALAGAY